MTRNNKAFHLQSSVCHGSRACQPLRRLRRCKASGPEPRYALARLKIDTKPDATTNGVRAITGIPDFLLGVEPFLRATLDANRASYIYAGLPGIANRLTDELSLHYQAQEATSRQLSNVTDLSVDLVASHQTTRRLTVLRQQVPRGEKGEAEQAEPDINAPIPNIGGIANIRLPADYHLISDGLY